MNGWNVVVGKGLYLVGLSTDYPKMGFIFSQMKERAMVFTGLAEARRFAEHVGGRVIAA